MNGPYAKTYTLEGAKVAYKPDILMWLGERTPWRDPSRSSRKYETFFNPVSGYLTVIPEEAMKPYTLYFPTNAQRTGEKYVKVILAVNGTPSFTYNETEERFDERWQYKSDIFETEVHIRLTRKAVEKEGEE